MKKLLLLAVVGLLVTSCEYEDTWNTACSLYDQEYPTSAPVCEGLDAPFIKSVEMERGMQGKYDGTNTIYISDRLSGSEKLATEIHEMVHYIDVKALGLPIPGPARLICPAEARAFHIEDVWWAERGQPDKARPNWWKVYPYCWKYYAPRTFDISPGQFDDYIEWFTGGGGEEQYIL